MKGIICALKEEANNIISDMKYVKKTTVSGIEFTRGKLNGVEVVVAVSGVGKVFAAICTQTMIMKYSPELIINTGVAGSVAPKIHCGDILVARNVVQHDVDTTALGDPLGMISGINKTNFKCDDPTVDAILALFEQMEIKIHKRVVIATGDQFIASKEKRDHLRVWFGAAACDMESGAIAQVCYVNKVPFVVIRAISDEANGKSPVDYPTFMKSAADNAAKIVKAYIGGVQ